MKFWEFSRFSAELDISSGLKHIGITWSSPNVHGANIIPDPLIIIDSKTSAVIKLQRPFPLAYSGSARGGLVASNLSPDSVFNDSNGNLFDT